MSLMSMTGFGSATFDVDGQAYRLDIKSVNHKNLNVRLKLSSEFAHAEVPAKKLVKAKLKRGAVDVVLTRDGSNQRDVEITVDREGLAAMLGVLSSVAEEVGSPAPTLETALRYGDFLDVHRKSSTPEALADGLMGALGDALAALRTMREREAAELMADITERLAKLDSYLDEVDRLAPEVYAGYAERLKKRLEDAAERHGLELDPGRVATELVVWSDKSDVTEEVVRARAHMVHVRELMEAGKDETGKKLDFLAQELFREFNTIGSKCRDVGMAAQVVDAKVELEKIREQVQNIA